VPQREIDTRGIVFVEEALAEKNKEKETQLSKVS